MNKMKKYLLSIGIDRWTISNERKGMSTLSRGDTGVNEVFDTMEYPSGWSMNFEVNIKKLGYELELKSDNYLNIVPEGV